MGFSGTIRGTIACLCVAAAAATALAQAPATQSALAQGWAHLGANRIDEAIKVGEAVLADGRDSYRAVALLVAAEVAARRPLGALDRYEQWIGQGRPDDIYLLTEIAIGFARHLAAGSDPLVQAQARAILARIDDAPDQGPDQAGSNQSQGVLTDAALARSGDQDAAARLRERLKGPMGPEAQYVIGALAESGDGASVPALRDLLSSPQPMVQLAAIGALGTLGDTASVPALKALLISRQPMVATQATVALARLGDADANASLDAMLASPVGDLRLTAAEAIGINESARWSEAVTPLLDDPNLLLRVRVAILLSRAGVNSERAQIVLAQSLGSENPVLREQAGEAFIAPDQADPLLLRRFLRDPIGSVQLRGIQGFLALTRR
jgi:HEAT repeat protein